MTMTENPPSTVNLRLLGTFELARAGRRQDGTRTRAELRADAEAEAPVWIPSSGVTTPS